MLLEILNGCFSFGQRLAIQQFRASLHKDLSFPDAELPLSHSVFCVIFWGARLFRVWMDLHIMSGKEAIRAEEAVLAIVIALITPNVQISNLPLAALTPPTIASQNIHRFIGFII